MRAIIVVVASAAALLVAREGSAQTWGESPPPPAQPGTGLEAGGLRPPTSQPEPAAQEPGATEQELERATLEDSGRGLEYLWLVGEAGFEHVSFETLSASELVDPATTPTSQSGAVFGAGLGMRLVFVTVGARFRYGAFADWRLWTLGAEVGLHIPVGSLEPYVFAGGGYASVGGLDAGPQLQSAAVDVAGWHLRAGGGLDWYLSSAFSIGANVSGDVLFLSRSSLDPAATGSTTGVYALDGSSVGAGVTTTAVVGLHF